MLLPTHESSRSFHHSTSFKRSACILAMALLLAALILPGHTASARELDVPFVQTPVEGDAIVPVDSSGTAQKWRARRFWR